MSTGWASVRTALLVCLSLVFAGCVTPDDRPFIVDEDGKPVYPVDVQQVGAELPQAGLYATGLEDVHSLTYRFTHHAGSDVGPVASPIATPGSGLLDPSNAPDHEEHVTIQYRGVATIPDEWGREVPAFHFTAEEMVYKIPPEEGAIKEENAQWVVVTTHYAHDLSDGRNVGVITSDHLRRTFPSDDGRAPGLQMDIPVVPFMAWRTSGPFTEDGGRIWFQELQQDPAGCTVFELRVDDDPDVDGYWDSEAAKSAGRTTLCMFDGDDAPLWMRWEAPQGDSDGAWSEWEREGAGVVLPVFQGDPLPPFEYDEQPMQPLQNTMGLALPPLDVLPSGDSTDWAARFQEVIEALYQDPVFIQFLQLGGDNARIASGAIGLPLSADDPKKDLGYDEWSWLTMTTDSSSYMGWVYTDHGDLEQPDRHDAETGRYFEGLPMVEEGQEEATYPLPADIQHQLGLHLPGLVNYIGYSPPDRDDVTLERFPSNWFVMQICENENGRAGERGPTASIDAGRGALLEVSLSSGGLDRCAVGIS